MSSQFLSLNDRFDPEDENDQDEVVKLATALDEVEGRPVQQRSADTVSQLEVAERTVAFQKRAGLKPDGEVTPKGPTATRIAADQIARRSGPKPKHRQVLGRGANLPLWGTFGAGGDNLPRDRRAMSNALTLVGYKPKPPGSGRNSQDADDSKQEDEATTGSLKQFQVSHGLRADGVAEPFGPTHNMLDHVIAPRLEKLVGPDPTRPKPFEKPEPQYVGRKVPLRPMMIRSHLQDDEDLDNEAEYQAAVDLGQMIRDDMVFMEASISPLDGDDTDDRAELDAKNDPGRNADTPKAAEEETKPAPLYHNNVGSPIERAQSFLKTRRFVDLRENPSLQEKVNTEQAEYFSGKPTAAVEAGLIAVARQARRPSTPHEPRPSGDPRHGGLYPRLVVARMELLAARYREENPEFPEEEINRKVLEKTAYGLGLPNEEARLLLEFTPYVGPILTFMDVAELADGVHEMIEDGEINPEIIMLAAAMAPGVGKGARRSKSGPDTDSRKDGPESDRTDDAADPSDSPGDRKGRRENDRSDGAPESEESRRETLDEGEPHSAAEVQAARRSLLGWRKAAKLTGEAKSAQELFDPSVWAKMGPKMQGTVESLFSHAKRRGSEAHLYRTMEIAGVLFPVEEGRLRRTRVLDLEGRLRTRNWEQFSDGWLEESLDGREIIIVDRGLISSVELKSGKSKLNPNQRAVAEGLEEGHENKPFQARDYKGAFPEIISKNVIDLRMPLLDIPEEELVNAINDLMSRRDVPEEFVEHLVANIRDSYRLAEGLENSGFSDKALGITLAAVLGINLARPDDDS